MTRRDLTAVRPRPIYCVVENRYRRLKVAVDAARGRFRNAGLRLELGLPPDWSSSDLPEDEEWAIEWRKFYFGLDLSHVFRLEGALQYLESWETLVESFLRSGAPLSDPSDVIGRRVQNWIYAWLRFSERHDFAGLRWGLAEQIVSGLSIQLDHLRDNLTAERNHRTLELYTLFVAVLALPGLDPDGSVLEFAVGQLGENLLADVLEDGVHREASTHYHMITLRSFLGARENARRFGLKLPDAFDCRLERACEFAMHAHAPDGRIPALSDSDVDSYLDLLALAGDQFSRPDFTFVATRGRQGTPPRELHGHFPRGGYFFQRSGWPQPGDFDDSRFLTFDCGPLGDGGHGHYDALSVEIHSQGRRLIVDPGRHTYHEGSPNWRRWFKSTAAHNTVCVDGLDQSPYRRGRHRGPRAEARLLGSGEAAGLSLLWGEVRSPCYDAIHRRRILFLGGEYWLIEDQLHSETTHSYDLRFHLDTDAEGAVDLADGKLGHELRAPGVRLTIVGAREAKLVPGFVSPEYGTRRPAPILSLRDDGRRASFLTLVAPTPPGAAPWQLKSVLDLDRERTLVELTRIESRGPIREWVAFSTHAGIAESFEAVPGVSAFRSRHDPSGQRIALDVLGDTQGIS